MKHLTILLAFLLITSCSKKWADNIAEKGHRQEMSNNYEKALKIYNKGIRWNKKSTLLFWRRGGLNDRNENYNLAINDFSKSIELDSLYNTGYAYWSRANSKESLGDFEGALLDFNNAVLINPKKSNFICYRGILKYKMNDYKGALLDLNKAVELWNNYHLARNYRSTIRFKLKDYKGALEDFNFLRFSKKDEMNPNMAWEFRNRGISKLKTKDTIGACKDWKIAQKHNDSISLVRIKEYCE
jgi:tetratricopeptide (TPR) repeat protein